MAGETPPSVAGAPGEFEAQDYIWLPWIERGFLGAAPLSSVVLEVIRAISPAARIRLLHSGQLPRAAGVPEPEPLDRSEAQARLRDLLAAAAVDLARVELLFHPLPYGAIQDAGPFFLRGRGGGLAVADYRLNHPDPRAEAMDRDLAAQLGLPTVRSALVSEGGARQSNGRGTLLLARPVELARNPGWSLAAIEREHLRVHGARKVIWLEQGPAEDHWGKLGDGRWGIGSGGHVDVFARFADPSTVLLAKVSDEQRERFPVLAQTHDRMEPNWAILRSATDQDGRALRILPMPVPDPLVASLRFDALAPHERAWFPDSKPGETIEYYLPASYLNFLVANGVVATARLHRPGRSDRYRDSDEQARAALQRAFPGRKIVPIAVEPLLHGGGGLHCHSRNQPAA